MGGQQSKRRKPACIPDSERDELTKSLSYQSNDDGTSVDTESASLQQEVPTTLTPLSEECIAPESNVMSGLPGETAPAANFYLENNEERETQSGLKPVSHDEYLKEKESSKESVNFDSSQRFFENSGKKDNLNSDSKLSFEAKSPILLERMKKSENVDGDVYLHSGDVLAGGMNMVDGRPETTGQESNFDLKDNEMANKNYHFPVHYDAKGVYKKKVTTDTDDNRCHCPLSDYTHSEIHKQIFSNVIFLPDKSKGASPKRYGPKRLGSLYDNSIEDAERIDPATQVLSYSHNEVHFDSKKDQQTSASDGSQTKKLDIDDRPNCDTDTANEKVQGNDPDVLTFVEDHFGFYTGCIAEGISKEFQGQINSTSKEIGTELSKSLTFPDNKVETNNNNSENKLPENAESGMSSNSKNLESKEHVKLKASNVESGQRRNVNPHKTDKEMCNNTIRGDQKTGDQMAEEEVIDICKNCKEPGDLCLCLFPDTKTVMHVKMKAPLSHLRYMSINSKEIKWPSLKSAQAMFIKRLKSHKCEISEDNRVAFEFSLPSCKGFFGPDQRKREGENCDEEKSTGLVKAIEKKFGLQLTGIPLTASIDSSKNIIINDFDGTTDDDDDVTDDETYDETYDESDREHNENSYKTKCSYNGEKLTLSEKLNSGQINFHSEERDNCFRCKNQSFDMENQNPGSNSETSIKNDIQEEQSVSKEDKGCILESFTDKSSRAFSFRYSPKSFLNKSLSSYEKSFTENGQVGEFDIKCISAEQHNSFEDVKLNTRANKDMQTLLSAEQLKCSCGIRKDVTGNFDVKNDCCKFDLKTERREINEVKEEGNEKSCNSSETKKLDKVLKEDSIQKDIKKQCLFKRIKTCFEEDNRFKLEVISVNFKQAQDSNNHSTFRAFCHENDEVNIQNQLSEEDTDENNNVSVHSYTNVATQEYNIVDETDLELQKFKFETESECENSDFSSSSEDTEKSDCSFEDSENAFLCSFSIGKIENEEDEFIGKAQEYDDEDLPHDAVSSEEHKFSCISVLQREPCFIKTENNTTCDELSEHTDVENLQSEKKLNNFQAEGDTTAEIKQSDRYLEPTSEFHIDVLGSESNENHLNSLESKDKNKCEITQSGNLSEHLKVRCDTDGQQNDKQDKQFAKADITKRKGSHHTKEKDVLYEDNNKNVHTTELKNMEGENVKNQLSSILKRKQTRYEADNRLAQSSSDDETEGDYLKAEAAHVTDEKETSKTDRTDKKEEKNIPSFQSFQKGQSSGTLIRRFVVEGKDLDFSLPPQEFSKQLQEKNADFFEKLKSEADIQIDSTLPPDEILKQLQEKQAWVTGIAKGLGIGNEFQMDFSLPPDEFLKQLQEKQASLNGSLVKLQQKGEHMVNHSRYDERLPKRPETAKSVFASSFYDTSPQKVDISLLGKDMSGISAATGSDEKVKSGPGDGEIRQQNSLRVLQEKVDADLMAMLQSDRSDPSVSSSASESLVDSSDDSSDDYDVPAVKVTDIWIPVIQQEKTKCQQSTSFQENLRCTVLCVDVSASMRGLPWQQLRTFISEFLSGLEGKRHGDNIEEYVAMVTFGCETRIVAQPTKSYGQLVDVLDSINPDGISPLLPGLALSMLFQTVRRESGRGCCRVSDITLDHRIILLSDGHPSLSSDVGSSDEFLDELQHQEAVQEVKTSLQEWMLPLQQAHVDCVPIGETPNIDFLETVCMATKGRMIAPSDVEVLVNSTHNHYVTAQVADQMFKLTKGKADREMFKALIHSLLPDTTAADLAEMCTLLKTANKRVQAKQRKSGIDTWGDEIASHFGLEPNNLPKIGTRVCIGQGATEKLSKIATGNGIITGHSRKHKGKVFVRWDSGVNTLCRFGYQDKFEVFPDKSAVLCKSITSESIKTGYKVRRGPDWQSGNQDGGGDQLGTVRHIQTDGFIRVSWPNGVCSKYRYNHNGAFDVIIADPSDPFGNKNFEVEMNKKNEENSQIVMQSAESVDVSSNEN